MASALEKRRSSRKLLVATDIEKQLAPHIPLPILRLRNINVSCSCPFPTDSELHTSLTIDDVAIDVQCIC